jgi:hypothetical protein
VSGRGKIVRGNGRTCHAGEESPYAEGEQYMDAVRVGEDSGENQGLKEQPL